MPFLDHLEELRTRLIRILLAVLVGFVVGFFLVQQFNLVSRLKTPIAPYLAASGGKLAVLSPTEPVMIVLKLGFVLGLVLASPVIIWQIWAFVAPALYERERKAILPALIAGLGLFLVGAAGGWVFVVPRSLDVLFSFQSDALAPVITYDAYFDFVLTIVLGLGLSFELPLVIVILAALGVVTPAGLNRFRQYNVVLACVAGAFLSPGTDVLSMLMMTIPLLLLYEVGVVGSIVIHRRRRKRAAAATGPTALLLALLLPLAAPDLTAQEPAIRPPPLTRADSLRADSLARDSVRARSAQRAIDSATAKRMGLPTAPVRALPAPDTVIAGLLQLRGFVVTRYMADSATLLADAKRIELNGAALTERQKSVLEAERITYDERQCLLDATGDPHLFDKDQVVVGERVRYDTCIRRGVVNAALTNFKEGGTVWFLRGSVAQDSTARRLFAASGEFTSCDLPVAHYHFGVKQVKWISQTVMVARPAVLYVRDVPVLWLPFILQDARPGRRSGILVPQFGINDIVRPNGDYSRQITNIGYYWAPNDYMDVTARLDWFANRYTQWGLVANYKWLDQFLEGSVAFTRTIQSGGGASNRIQWRHTQRFNLSTTLNALLDYATDTRVIGNNAIDPYLNTRKLRSNANFQRRFRWGTLNLGGSRDQNLSDGSGTEVLPSLTLSPKPLDLGSNVTWSPGLTFTRDRQFGRQPQGGPIVVPDGLGGLDTLDRKSSSRTMSLNIDTPVRLWTFNWRNSLSYVDRAQTGRQIVTVRVPDTTTASPNDSITVSRVVNGDFESALSWDTGINLPLLFRRTWKVQPSVNVTNAIQGQPFLIRNRLTAGDWVAQPKRFTFGLSTTPTFFGFFPGFAGLSRIRHTFQPTITYQLAPATSIPREFARAITPPGQQPVLRAAPQQSMSVGMSNVFEGKGKPAPGDTALVPEVRKIRLLSISTSALTYDFEQAKQPGRTGWTTQSISNSFQTDLLQNFTLTIAHDLWEGAVGSDTARFKPFLSSVSASFGLSARTLYAVGRLLGLTHKTVAGGGAPSSTSSVGGVFGPRQGAFFSPYQSRLGRQFEANVNYTLSRARPIPGSAFNVPAQSNVSFSTSFSPTAFWSVSWQTNYNFTKGGFEEQIVRLERQLHEWRASFNFTKNPNGNFAFYFQIALMDLPELKFDYNQTTILQ
ncbi:MAG: twin-arginine translocase subunit TatC [Gemmatimonadota bacterium]